MAEGRPDEQQQQQQQAQQQRQQQPSVLPFKAFCICFCMLTLVLTALSIGKQNIPALQKPLPPGTLLATSFNFPRCDEGRQPTLVFGGVCIIQPHAT